MPLPIAMSGERLSTKLAGVRPPRGVHSPVRDQALAHAEGLAARVAREGALARVRPAVVF